MRNGPIKVILVMGFVSSLGISILGGWYAVSLRTRSHTGAPSDDDSLPEWVGSASCRQCHESFYQRWSNSFHGLALQPFTKELAQAHLTPCPSEFPLGSARYRFLLTADGAVVREQGPTEEKDHAVVHVMGGKNVYYFMTPLERGRLQVLPLAYDVRRKEWFDTPASAVRHFDQVREQPLDWRDPLYTFNTSCHGCHVSQLTANYDLKTDSYRTTWKEPGINCETCHGPSGRHVQAFVTAPADRPPEDLKLISTKVFTPAQHNAACSGCHAKMSWITASYPPGERFFDHYDLVTLESPDFYPDGRDLGENYTYTGWLMNACARSGQMHCLHCHTSSGRYRFQDRSANDACLPCHEGRVKNATAHTHHKEGSPGNQCIACHMPQTEFARMRRTDHSLRPPTPATTLAHKSPNACNLCHKDREAAWADREVRRWHKDDYQARVVRLAGLVSAARNRDWARLPEMLSYLGEAQHDEIFTTSLIRLLNQSTDGRKWPALIGALKDSSPLVRSAAAHGLTAYLIPEARTALLGATQDGYRLVRVRAAGALAALPRDQLTLSERQALDKATAELEASLKARPDDWTSQYNLGNHYFDQNQLPEALAAFLTAHRLRPDVAMPLAHAALAQVRLGRPEEAETLLNRAFQMEPENALVNFNLGLFRAEQGVLAEAERHFRLALKADPGLARAAYNLAVILAGDRLEEAIEVCRQAHQAQPGEPKFTYTLAFYLEKKGRRKEAVNSLRQLLTQHPLYLDAYTFLGAIHEKSGEKNQALEVYRRALAQQDWLPVQRQYFEMRLRALTARDGGR